MDNLHRFRQAATGMGIPVDEVTRFARLVLRFRIRASEGTDGVPVGRFGGLPRLPRGLPWPSVVPGAPLAYAGSLECAALPRIDGLALPVSGSLLFFLAASAAAEARSVEDEQRFAQVIHVPAGAEIEVTEPPEDEFDDDPLVGAERELIARVEADLPQWLEEPEQSRSPFQQSLALGLPHIAELRELVDRLWPGRIPWIGDDVLVGGYAISAQNSPEGKLASRMPGAATEAEHRVTRDWVALAQFGVPGDEELFNGRFLICHDDLAAGRFDEALSFCELVE